MYLFIILISCLIFGFWIWMLVDVVLNTSLDLTKRILWFLLILFTYLIGAAIYYFAGRNGDSTGLPSTPNSIAQQSTPLPPDSYYYSEVRERALTSPHASPTDVYPQPLEHHAPIPKSNKASRFKSAKVPVALAASFLIFIFLSLTLSSFSIFGKSGSGGFPVLNKAGGLLTFIMISLVFLKIIKSK